MDKKERAIKTIATEAGVNPSNLSTAFRGNETYLTDSLINQQNYLPNNFVKLIKSITQPMLIASGATRCTLFKAFILQFFLPFFVYITGAITL